MALEELAIAGPSPFVEYTVGTKTLAGAVSHEERMMGVVVCEQSLPAKAYKIVYGPAPTVQTNEVLIITFSVNRIGLGKAPDGDFSHGRAQRQAGAF